MPNRSNDLSVTAFYTSEAWRVHGFPCAELLATSKGRRLFRLTNGAVGLVRLFRRDVPSLRESLKLRHQAIDHLARKTEALTIIELAAGLSPRGASMTASGEVTYIEIDMPAVIAQKKALLDRTEAGRAVLLRENFRLVPADLRTMDLRPLAGSNQPILVIAEGLFMYLDREARIDLFRRVAAMVEQAGSITFLFDLVPGAEEPPPGRVGRLFGRIFRKKTRGSHFIRDEATRESIRSMLRDAGFSRVEIYDETQLPKDLEKTPSKEPVKLVLFDCMARDA